MADSIVKSGINELVTRLTAYSFPELESGTGAWTVNTVETNPRELTKFRPPVIYLYWNPTPAGIDYENVGQWMVTYSMQATLRVKRYKDPDDTGIKLAQYLQQAIWKNTSGVVDPNLNGYAGNLLFKDVEVDYGDAREPIIDVHITFDVVFLYKMTDPTSIT